MKILILLIALLTLVPPVWVEGFADPARVANTIEFIPG
jgi:hypothetical protein